MNDLTIINTAIRRDSAGRYCLNDLHKAAVAAGANARTKEPGKFFATEHAREVIRELAQETPHNLGSFQTPPLSPVFTAEGRSGGTYVVKELDYSYAMWISPSFHLKVVRAYDSLVTGNYVKPLTQAEKYWFGRRPHWQSVREQVFNGATYAQAGQRLTPPRSASSVGYAIRRMIAVGLINPVEFIRLRYFPQTAERLIAGNKQMCLEWGVQA